MNGEIGQVIDGKYRLTRLLGQGGMGAVYEGENLRIHRRVAIKMLHAEVSSQAETVTRFEREAQAAGRIGSEHICEVLDLGVMPDGTRYMVMEYLEGENFGERIKKLGRLTPTQAVPLIAQMLDGLEAAHAVGIIHRDLKPDNVWILPTRGGTKDFVKVLDFGVSKFSQAAGGDEFNATRAGSVVGTPYYMSPEQARGMGTIDGRTDIYAIGVVLYQAVTGQVPYQAETFNELLFKIVLEVAPPPQTYVPDLDPEFAGIIIRAMAREPGQRYQTCAEFKAALLAFQARVASGAPAQAPAPQAAPPRVGVHGTAFFDASPMASGGFAERPAMGLSSPNDRASSPALGPQQPNQAWPAGGISVGPTGPQLGATTPPAWGNASGSAVAQQPKSKAGMVIGIIAALVVAGGVAAAAFLLRAPPSPTSAEASATPSAAAAAQPSPAPSSPASTAPTAESTSATASAAPSTTPSATPSAAEEPSAEPDAEKHPLQGHKFGPRPAPVVKPPPASTSKPPPSRPAAGDLGY